MKKWLMFLIVALAALLLPMLITGCVSTPTLLRPAATNNVAVVATNWFSVTNRITNIVTLIPATSNAPAVLQPQVTESVLRTPVITTNWQPIISPEVWYTNVSLAPGVGPAVSAVTGLAPVPGAGAIGGVFVALAGLATSWVNERRKRVALGQQADTWQTAAKVLVNNVESIRTAASEIPGYDKVDSVVMAAATAAQKAAGVHGEIHDLVQKQT